MELLIVLIPLLPFLGFVGITLFTKHNKRLSAGLAIALMAASWIASWIVIFRAFATEHFEKHPFHVPLFAIPTGKSVLELGFVVDNLTAAMLFMVPFVCLMIFWYSWGYMGIGLPAGEHDRRGWPAESGHVDPLASRFFAYISLFATGMLGLVLSDNLVTLFVFWEVMGLCSYLLIGFWFARKYDDPKRITPKQAGLKAFLTTRIGDTIMLAGMMLLYASAAVLTDNQAGLTFSKLFEPQVLEGLQRMSVPVFGSMATLTAILIFWGSIGKSSQWPLHVWLPDAMEGPTPVSALIHAATMVSAGVYLIIRMFPLMLAGVQPALTFLGFIGAFTALFAAVIAVAQNDIKRVLAYSTISQLGYMFAALGIGAYVAATFHLLTHAFFKALLFLSSGSVIHGMEHGEHHVHHEGHHEVHGFDANDMRFMGGLRHKQPWTFIAFVAGGLALSGFPIVTAGFWSKDEILAEAWYGLTHGDKGAGLALFVFILLVLAAFLTAFYTWRQISMTFLGKPRTESAAHAHESSWSMVAPLLILAVFAIFGGFIGVPENFPVLGPLLNNPFHHWIGHFAETLKIKAEVHPFNPIPLLFSVVVALGGLGVSHLIYGRAGKGWQTHDQLDPLEAAMQRVGLGWLYEAMRRKFYFDELYAATVVAFGKGLAKAAAWFDRTVVDGIVNGVGRMGVGVARAAAEFDVVVVDGLVNATAVVAGWAGGLLRLIQTGRVQTYLLVAMMTVFMLLALFMFYL
ncbi:MAG: NADH-quinone oxidoreductase subunit L [Caldilineales bacterium]|nr:NADH-quinone oxidoreductase subunit L [Caldilineales bacterium]MDW8318247.1 NADH-quinone oxidoreductase subunit L [Anaerolineae bacterium]